MSKYRLKQKEVEAVQHLGPQALVVVTPEGEKKANPGDWIILPPAREDGTPGHHSQRKVMVNKDFLDQYEIVGGEGEGESEGDSADSAQPGQPGSPTSVYGVPAFDSVEAAQAAAADHYRPGSTTDDEGNVTARPASSTPFQCTIGSDGKVYAIQPSGIISQVPVAHQSSTADPGFGTGSGYQDSHYPQPLAIQGLAVRDNPGPVSAFQQGSASVEQPLTTFGNVMQPDQAGANNEAAKTVQPDRQEAERQKAEGVTEPEPGTDAAAERDEARAESGDEDQNSDSDSLDHSSPVA